MRLIALIISLSPQFKYYVCLCTQSFQLCPTLCVPMDCSPPGSLVHGILQARILEWVAMPSSRGSSWPRDQTHVSCGSCLAGRFVTTEPPGKPLKQYKYMKVFVHWNIIFDVEIEFEWRFGCTRLSFMSIFTCVPSFLNLIIVSNRISWSQPEIFLKVKILPRTLRFNLLPQVSTCLFCELDIKGLGIVLSLTFYFLLIISNISRKVKVLIGLFRITFCFLILLHLPWNLQEMEKVAIWICRKLKI